MLRLGVVARIGDRYCLKGDARIRPDGWHRAQTFTARVVHIDRGGRSVPVRTGRAAAVAGWLQSVARLLGRLRR